jgi:sugar lactone lactonase YvrE
MSFKNTFPWVACLGLAALIPFFQGCGKNVSPAAAAPGSGSSTPSYSFSTFFGNGVMDQPLGLAISGDVAWVSNSSGTNSLEGWGLLGVLKKNITTYSTFTITSPRQVAVGADGYVYMADGGNSQVAEFSPVGAWENVFGKTQLGTDFPEGVAVNANYAYISDNSHPAIYRYTLSGSGPAKTFTASATFGNSGPGALSTPYYLALDGSGNLYVADATLAKVMVYNADGVFQNSITPTAAPSGIALDSLGNLYLDAGALPDIEMLSPSGSLIAHIGTGTVAEPVGMAFDSAGNLYATDQYNFEVAVFQRN